MAKKNAVISDDYEGEFIYTSWGYDQTNVNFAKIIEVSDSGKTVLCQMVRAERVDGETVTSESVKPTDETYGDEFRLQVREGYNDDYKFRGSYPYIDGDMDRGERLDSFRLVGDRETLSQTATNFGH